MGEIPIGNAGMCPWISPGFHKCDLSPQVATQVLRRVPKYCAHFPGIQCVGLWDLWFKWWNQSCAGWFQNPTAVENGGLSH